MRFIPLLITAMLTTAVCSHAHAADFVMMKNGDRITGEIKQIWNGEVFIEPEYGDTYPIDLEYVAYVHTEEEFEVEFIEGRRGRTVTGRLGLDDLGKPSVIVDGGQEIYPLAKIDNMQEIEEFFEWELTSDISVNVATGNSDTQSARFNVVGKMKLGEHRHRLEYTRDQASAEGDTTKDQTYVAYEDMWTFREDWFIRGAVNWTRDPIKDLASRSQIFLGPGFHFWDDSKRTLNLSLGPNYLSEDIGGENKKSVAAQLVFRYEQHFLDDDLVVFQETDYQTIVSGRKNKILTTSTGIKWDVLEDVYVKIQVDFDYETEPASDRKKEDVTYLVGVGLELD